MKVDAVALHDASIGLSPMNTHRHSASATCVSDSHIPWRRIPTLMRPIPFQVSSSLCINFSSGSSWLMRRATRAVRRVARRRSSTPMSMFWRVVAPVWVWEGPDYSEQLTREVTRLTRRVDHRLCKSPKRGDCIHLTEHQVAVPMGNFQTGPQ